MFRHPKYYKELRKLRNKLDQAISDSTATAKDSVRPGPGPKHQATSYKLPGPRPISNANKGLIHRQQASSNKLTKSQASSGKHQAPSTKAQA
jgi:hypothetical protein